MFLFSAYPHRNYRLDVVFYGSEKINGSEAIKRFLVHVGEIAFFYKI